MGEPDPKKIQAMMVGIRAMKDADPEDILAAIAEIRAQFPPGALRPPRDRPELDPRLDGISEEDFAWDAAQAAAEGLLAELEGFVQAKRQALLEKVLDVYYAMEEASRDPKNAHLIPQLEKMRAAYFRDYGRPIPSKEETEARRRGGSR